MGWWCRSCRACATRVADARPALRARATRDGPGQRSSRGMGRRVRFGAHPPACRTQTAHRPRRRRWSTGGSAGSDAGAAARRAPSRPSSDGLQQPRAAPPCCSPRSASSSSSVAPDDLPCPAQHRAGPASRHGHQPHTTVRRVGAPLDETGGGRGRRRSTTMVVLSRPVRARRGPAAGRGRSKRRLRGRRYRPQRQPQVAQAGSDRRRYSAWLARASNQPVSGS